MLLRNIVIGEEASNVVLLHDTIQSGARALLGCFVKALVERVDAIHVILFDLLPENFLGVFSAELRTRICCYDGFTDPLHWNSSEPAGTPRMTEGRNTLVHTNSDLASIISKSVCQGTQHVQNDAPVKVAIVIDSLDHMIQISPANTCHTLSQLSKPKNQLGYQVLQVIALVHSDLHDVATLETINFVGQTVLWVSQSPGTADSSTSSDSTDRPVEYCRILHKRRTGKVLKKTQQYSIGQEFDLTEFPEEDWDPKPAVQSIYEPQQVDPTSNLPFNLKLTAQEKQARSQVKLPYTFHEQPSGKAPIMAGGEAKIFYQPDDADDFDEDDPDDDLDI